MEKTTEPKKTYSKVKKKKAPDETNKNALDIQWQLAKKLGQGRPRPSNMPLPRTPSGKPSNQLRRTKPPD